MQKKLENISLLAKHLVFLIVAYSFCRALFYLFNFSYFSDLNLSKVIVLFFFGIRFDISVIILINFLFIFFYLLPFPIREWEGYRKFLKVLFISTNGIALFANCVDFTYFPFTFKRTNASALHFFGGEIGNDLARLIPELLKGYWYIFLLGAFFIYSLYFIYSKLEKSLKNDWTRPDYIFQGSIFIVAMGLSIVLYRGGFQLKPVSPVTAGEYTSSKYIPLILNTPFTILKTIGVNVIEPSPNWKITDKKKLEKIYSPIHKADTGKFKKMNVILIALESFSKEYIGSLNNRNKGFTPFLDSLISEGLIFTNAQANGKTSIDGIPSIISSIPTWMNEPYITSAYGTNRIKSIATLLKEQGYYTAFFHGGTNGTMGFDAFSKVAGYKDYFGRLEYNNENDFDGNWGIWDEEFLQYTNKTISQKPQPFFATIFTLSSHHPYKIPKKYNGKFKEGDLEIEKSVSYADYALQQFFESAQKMPWYNNTLFVLCADHTGYSRDKFYVNKVGNYSIPILYYQPGKQLKGVDTSLTQQIDILPSILDYLNYPSPYFSFGNSVFDSSAQRFAMTYNNNLFKLMEGDYVAEFDGDKLTDLYNYRTDSLLTTDLIEINKEVADKMETRIKAIIQTYQQSLIKNKMR